MDCIILAGGKGTRLKKTVSNVPKPLAPINNIPFLDILIKQIKSINILEKIILAVGYKSSQIIDYYKNDNRILFSEEKTLLGTGGALQNALKLTLSENILVLNGDSYTDINFNDMWQFHLKQNSTLTIAYRSHEELSSFGTMQIEKDSQKILSFVEKKEGTSGFISLGIYIINRNIFQHINLGERFSLEHDFFPKILKTTDLFGFYTNSLFIDIGTKESYQKAQTLLK